MLAGINTEGYVNLAIPGKVEHNGHIYYVVIGEETESIFRTDNLEHIMIPDGVKAKPSTAWLFEPEPNDFAPDDYRN